MARPKTFAVDEAVDRAMQTFWTHGYGGTSAQRLVDDVGISRSSLYDTFGSKDELYRSALRRYGEFRTLPDLPAADVREALRWLLANEIAPDLDPADGRGCFACNAAVERGPLDAEVRDAVDASFAGMRQGLADVLAAGVASGELDLDPWRAAGSLLVTLEGLHVVAKGTRDAALVASAIDDAVAAL